MSGRDEMRPTCNFCKRQDDDNKLDIRRLYAINKNGQHLLLITSERDEYITGFRIATYNVPENASRVIVGIYCQECGNKTVAEDYIFQVKQYVWNNAGSSTTTIANYETTYRNVLSASRDRPANGSYIPAYDEYTVDGDGGYCEGCGELFDDCSCDNEDYCSECGYMIDDCVCEDYCPDCGNYECTCDDDYDEED